LYGVGVAANAAAKTESDKLKKNMKKQGSSLDCVGKMSA
jgi:hypothetical protein